MIAVLLTILKILGIILLVLLGIILFVLLTVLFVPVRYDIKAVRKADDASFVHVRIRLSWLLHLISGAFSYPEEAFFRVRLLGVTIFRSDHAKKNSSTEKKKEKKEKNAQAEKTVNETPPEKREVPPPEEPIRKEKERKEIPGEEGAGRELHQKQPEEKKKNKFFAFLNKIWSFLKNIQYTITKICDKIKHIVKNIRYYMELLQSDTFQRVWHICGGEVIALLKSILPRRLEGQLHVGTGDPAGTGQILSLYGILYPLIGNHIDILPDFEQAVLEGELLAKGRMTVFRALKTAWIVYFNKDLRRLIQLLKREAV